MERYILTTLGLFRESIQFQQQFLVNWTLVFSDYLFYQRNSCLFTEFDFSKTEINQFHFCFDKLQLVLQHVSPSQRKRIIVNSCQII